MSLATRVLKEQTKEMWVASYLKSSQKKHVVSYFADNRRQLKLCGNELIQ